MSGSVLNEGRAAFRAQAWPEAFDHLQAAQAESPLEPRIWRGWPPSRS